MADFNLDIEASMVDCCNTLQVCDVTCENNFFDFNYQPCAPKNCDTGYSYDGNPDKKDVASTKFNFVFPDGNSYLGVDVGWKPDNRAYAQMKLTGGTSGTIMVDVNGTVLGWAIFTTSIQLTLQQLLISINTASNFTGFRAFFKDGTTDTLWIQAVWGGTSYNGMTLKVTVSGDLTATTPVGTTTGGTDADNCAQITLGDIYGNDSTDNFPSGVYSITYITYDSLNVELGRVTEKVLIDCSVVECMLNTLLSGDDCSCNATIDENLVKVRMKIEQAKEQFAEGLYDCANKTIMAAEKLCTNICLDC